MKRSDFSYQLPPELIAQKPTPERSGSRLLMVDGTNNKIQDRQFIDFPTLLKTGDLLIFNNTRVIPARLLGRKESGGRVEVLIERIIDNQCVLAHVRASKSPKTGSQLVLEENVIVEVGERQGDLFELKFADNSSVIEILDRVGHIPLPPYIDRPDSEGDRERYQTVYAQQPGAVAAPTAGLHFDHEVMASLKDKGIEIAFITLHVGAGTFQPVRAENLADHHMHRERVQIDAKTCDKINAARQAGRRVIAVGTTVVRSLESATTDDGVIRPFQGETEIFIYPGYRFKIIDVLLTNFHLPESTLLMLVCAFAGRELMLQAYHHAIEQRYRFFSYGDAMLITPPKQSQ